MLLELAAQGALNVNLVTPTHYAPEARSAVAAARAEGLSLPVVWNTSGYETVEAVRANAGTVDVYLSDFKYADAALAARYSHAPDYPEVAIKALEAMVDEVGAPAFRRGGRHAAAGSRRRGAPPRASRRARGFEARRAACARALRRRGAFVSDEPVHARGGRLGSGGGTRAPLGRSGAAPSSPAAFRARTTSGFWTTQTGWGSRTTSGRRAARLRRASSRPST